MTGRKIVMVGDFLTDEEIARAAKLHREAEPGTFASRCAAEIVEPNLGRINKALGQENSVRFLAYAIEYALVASGMARR